MLGPNVFLLESLLAVPGPPPPLIAEKKYKYNNINARTLTYRVRLFAWLDFTTIYITCFESQFLIVQFGCSVLPPSDIKGMLTIENELKYFNLVQPFEFWVKSFKTLYCDDEVFVL